MRRAHVLMGVGILLGGSPVGGPTRVSEPPLTGEGLGGEVRRQRAIVPLPPTASYRLKNAQPVVAATSRCAIGPNRISPIPSASRIQHCEKGSTPLPPGSHREMP